MSEFKFKYLQKEDVLNSLSIREGEVKIGETCFYGNQLDVFSGKYVVVGVSEDIGPRANLGFCGATNAFSSFLTRFINLQSNRFFNGADVLMYGSVSISGFENTTLSELREGVSRLDDFLEAIIYSIFQKGFIPIVIGGGHNNAYPIIKSASRFYTVPLTILNCDPHADFRILEGRHSGNPFSQAFQEGYIDSYTVLGLHESYNSEDMYRRMEHAGVNFTFFESYIDDEANFKKDIASFCDSNVENYVGCELDLDAIKGMPSSAFTPSGFELEEVRFYVRQVARLKSVTYLHLPEGAPVTLKEEKIVGKALAYLVSDFIKTRNKSRF